MMSSINSINQTQNLTQLYSQNLSSGKRINSAADNPAALAIVDAMTAQLGGQSQAANNITSGLSITDTADSALSQVTDSLQQMRDLTVQAGDASLNASDRQNIQDAINNIAKNLDGISSTTQFNGQNLLDGSFSGKLQIGPNAGDTQSLSLGNVSSSALGVSGLDVSSTANATNALNAIDNAIQNASIYQSNVASVSAGLNTSLSNINNTYQQLATARSRIQDTDYAQTTTDLNQAKIQNQVAVYAQKLYQDIQGNQVLGLLQNARQI